jgi:DNA polymerase I
VTILLIDADSIAFEAASAVQKVFKWDDDVYSTVADLGDAKEIFRDRIKSLQENLNAGRLVLCFSCPTRRYFRHDILPTYKSKRTGAPPIVLADLKAWATEEYDAMVLPKLEADDVIGIVATHPKIFTGRRIIVSEDKDMMQIPGEHVRMRDGKTFFVKPKDAEHFAWTQVLTGDHVDGYSGIPGIGPKKAAKILDARRPDETYLDAVLAAYLKAGLTKEDLVTQVNVARILQSPDYNFETKEPRLWSL